MIDEDWARPAPAGSPPIDVRVVAVVPLPEELGGAGEVLALSAFGSVKLPSAELRAGETVARAANRAVFQMAGVGAVPERLLYVIEQAGKSLTMCLLCALPDDEAPDERPGVRFVPVVGNDSEFEPPAVRELLLEDVRGGFVRPTAFASVGWDENGRERIDVSW
jgi:ADP-ribose pyrophosphatase YjhB (NUDIX family)